MKEMMHTSMLLFVSMLLFLWFVVLLSRNDGPQLVDDQIMTQVEEDFLFPNLPHSLRRKLKVAEAVSMMDGNDYTPFGSNPIVASESSMQQNSFQEQLANQNYVHNGNNGKKNKNNKLKAVIHIGPQKTGTTALQFVIKLMEGPLLEKDNFFRGREYFINHLAASFIDCFIPEGLHRRNTNFCNTTTYNSIRDIGRVGRHNLIMSAEDFSLATINLQQLKEFFIDAGYEEEDIIIVIYYRRFYEWFVSLDFQGRSVFPMELRQNIAHHLGMEQMRHSDENDKYTIGLYDKYSKVFPNVQIINMHNYTDVREPFFCDIMTNVAGAVHACEEYASAKLYEETKVNPKLVEKFKNRRFPQIYEEIAFWAQRQNMWTERNATGTTSALTLPTVATLVREYHEGTLNKTKMDFPPETITCIQEGQYDWILQKTLEIEERLFPEFYITVGREEILQRFPLLKNDFCMADAQMVLSLEHDLWSQFFISL